ncbi:hypothetical protein D9Q98_000934 [Chlorella vulgaris]|uniref:N-acetyltransferase domain-containing protein n=1 Tax=Chlorella vulgaris TaxID=3077 RepID=A0A9D4Z2T4_CHLVU|nr:hypothetical protein D9Q98_000934 [Chlorella vulgaris]
MFGVRKSAFSASVASLGPGSTFSRSSTYLTCHGRSGLCIVAATDGAAAAATEAAAAAAAALYGFCIEHELPHGRLVIRAAEEADVGAASVVLTRAFAGSAQGVPLSDGRKFCSDCLMQPPRGLLLVGRMFPSDTAQGAPRLRPGQMSRLMATAGLSFCSSTREAFPTLQPPDNAAYLANIAVDVTQRRLGYGRHMLAAAEALAAARGFRHLYLHVRLADQVARQLYDSAAYEVVGEDVVLLAKLRGITPRALMRKELTS